MDFFCNNLHSVTCDAVELRFANKHAIATKRTATHNCMFRRYDDCCCAYYHATQCRMLIVLKYNIIYIYVIIIIYNNCNNVIIISGFDNHKFQQSIYRSELYILKYSQLVVAESKITFPFYTDVHHVI